VSIKTPGSDVPESDRDLQTEIVSFGGNGSFGGKASFSGNGMGPGTGPLGTGTLAFEPGFTLDSQYTGETPQFAEGSQFGVYVVGPCIGEGGMARVYRAEHAGLKRQVALKVMTQYFARDSEGRERFLREARIAAAIKHPNVVNIFDVGVCQGIPYLVMELLEGEDLEKVLLSRGSLDEGTIIDLVVPVVAGLVAVHDAGIVHRDLKPGNIFLARGRNDEIEPKLLDFGISKASGKDHMRLTAANGSLMGTPFYMAPEAVQGAEMTPLSDQYALGVVLRECVTGKNPFEGGNFAEVVKLITQAQYPALAELNPRSSKRFIAIVDRAMSTDPKNRFEDMRAMGRQLLLLAGQRTRITWGLTFGQEGRGGPLPLATLQGAALPVAAPSPNPRRKRATAMLIAGVALLSASVTSLFLTSEHEEPTAAQTRGPARINDPTTTLVLPNSPGEEPSQPLQGSSVAAPAAPVPEAARPVVTSAAAPADDEEDDSNAVAREDSRRASAVSQALQANPRKQRTAARGEPERKAAPSRPATPQRRRPQAQPQPPQRTEEEDADWEINLVSRVPSSSKQNFEVGSNNAPILD
jgi:eukaryotic-like serine/threonine-protein kinase